MLHGSPWADTYSHCNQMITQQQPNWRNHHSHCISSVVHQDMLCTCDMKLYTSSVTRASIAAQWSLGVGGGCQRSPRNRDVSANPSAKQLSPHRRGPRGADPGNPEIAPRTPSLVGGSISKKKVEWDLGWN